MKEFFASNVGSRFLASIAIVAVLYVGWRYWSNRITPEKIAAGKVLFEHEWTVNDPLANRGDGLGPVFNDTSCVACHFQGGVGGGGPNEKNVNKFTILPTMGRTSPISGVIHKRATDDSLQETFEDLESKYPRIAGITRREGCYTVTEPDISPVTVTSINTPALFGLGLIEQIPDYAIAYHGSSKAFSQVTNELRGKFDNPGIGRLNMSGTRVGKFGWKGGFGTVEEFVATACAVELGLTVPGRGQDLPREYTEDRNAKYDMSHRQLHELVCFVKSLPRPEQILPDDPEERARVQSGEKIFADVGCADCHVPKMGGVEGIYSDFHLYRLTDPESQSSYSSQFNSNVEFPLGAIELDEWKTPPLWGVADSAPYMHDGSAETLETAISMHHGDADFSRQAFMKSSFEDQQALVAFLKTLRAPKMDNSDPPKESDRSPE